MPRAGWGLLAVAVVAAGLALAGGHDTARPGNGSLPPQARELVTRIQHGGPFAYRQDGGVFMNREGELPQRPGGYYREYTVVTPGSPDRGARRIISGGDPPTEFFYTDDHYRSFRRFTAAG